MADTPLLLGGTSANDVLTGGTADDVIFGQGGSDRLIGGDGNDKLNSGEYVTAAGAVADYIGDRLEGGNGDDSLIGGSGNDTLVGGANNDTISGAGGIDTAIYTGNRDEYTVARGNGAVGVTAIAGTDTDLLIGIERVEFTDSAIAYDIDGIAGQVYRLYQAALHREPDQAGLGYYFDAAAHGRSLLAIATGFTHSPEFAALYGENVSNETYIANLYRNALGREFDQQGMAYHMAALQNGLSREQLLINFSESPENQAQVIGAIQNGIEYDPVG